MTDTKHTPLPWRRAHDSWGLHISEGKYPKDWIALLYKEQKGEEEAEANAQLIVARVNAGPLADELAEAILVLDAKVEAAGDIGVTWPRGWARILAQARAYQKAMGRK